MDKINQVPYISQMPDWPTGCESVSTVMLLNYLGIPISVEEFVSFLPKKDLIEEDGQLYGYSPRNCFIGSPDDSESYGCYSDVIVKTVNEIAKTKGLQIQAVDISKLSTEEIIEQYIMHDRPVLYWTTIDMKPAGTAETWQLLDCNKEQFTWTSNEHCMLLVGSCEDEYVFNDPWNDNGIISYPKELVVKRHEEMFAMAVAITVKLI